MPRNKIVFCSSLATLVLQVGISLAQTDATSKIDFDKDVRPILSNHCFECHGPDEATREADLRLDVRTGAMEDLGGHAAIVAGNSADSELVVRIKTDDDDLRMPPGDHGEALTADQIRLLTRWIDQGAEYTRHWSFQPITLPEVPRIGLAAPENWRANPIDAFVFRKLAENNILPSAEADRETLIRRTSLDLLGLPPTIEEVDAFLNDRKPGAFERLIDRTLKNKHFGERWGRHWLDQARYADSNGYTSDGSRSMWPFRDWVIDAFNRDLPFDQFTIEQLAGDLLDSPTLSQRIATGFHRNTLISGEGGSKADQFRDEQVKDRIDTTGLVWMGLTVGCAKCHTHKFDPLTQTEYYQLYAFFNSCADRNSVSPTIKVATAAQKVELESLRQEQARVQKQIASDTQRAARQSAWEAKTLKDSGGSDALEAPLRWTQLDVEPKTNRGSKFKKLLDKSVLVSGKGTTGEDYRSTAIAPIAKIQSVRLEVLTDNSLPKKGPGRAGNGNFVLTEFWLETANGTKHRFASAAADHSQPGYGIGDAIDGQDESGWAINGAKGGMNQNRTAWFVLPEAVELKSESAITFVQEFHRNENYGIGRFRISASPGRWIGDGSEQQQLASILKVPVDERSAEQKKQIAQAFKDADPISRELDQKLDATTKAITALEKQIPTTMVLEEINQPRQAYVQVRGDFLRRGEDVNPGVPEVLPPLPNDASPNRLSLARWLVNGKHPLTARVRVNRIWMRLFGRGIVETENDFGIQSTLPSHPELLDWLASTFMREGWSTKQLLRTIMTSATYRQRSHNRDDLQTIDARNILLARQSRLRVEAEIVRDVALAASGALSEKVGGPSVYPPQPAGVYAFTQRRKSWRTSEGEDRFRRGMYTFFYRSAPYPMLSTFDVPQFNTVCTSRARSNTPLQSLTMANSMAMLELAEALGKRIMTEVPDDSDMQRVERAYRLCFARPPSEQEATRLATYASVARKRFKDESKVWTAVARVLMNLDEFVTRE